MRAALAPAARRSPGPAPGWWADYFPVPFRERARTRRGCDCRGLLFLVLEEQLGVRVPEPADLYASTDPRNAAQLAAFVRAQAALWTPCGVAPFAALSFSVAGLPVHVGVAVNPDLFLHTRRGVGVQLASLTDREPGETRWGDRLLGAYRYVG